ncbi:MAG TPA: hypothetical protein PLI16_07250 [Bacteroidales bacterium]|nr:hypothetical protein [Bacteroidales bacterium]HOH84393.1 hypothetical protein [Bacteroidales bacterium]
MKKVVCLFSMIAVFFISESYAQKEKLVRISTVETSGSYLAADNLGYIYLINESTLKKFDKDGLLQYTYTEFSDGKISQMDVNDPLKIMILNADFGKIKYLDNKLTLKKDFILLSDLGYPNAQLVAGSYDNGFWLFDPLTNQVVRFDKYLRASQNSGNIADITGIEVNPVFMTEADNVLYLNDPQQGIFLFDRYGTYLRQVPLKNLKTFQVFPPRVIFSEGRKLKMFDLKTFEESALDIPCDEEPLQTLWNNERVYVLTEKTLLIFRME